MSTRGSAPLAICSGAILLIFSLASLFLPSLWQQLQFNDGAWGRIGTGFFWLLVSMQIVLALVVHLPRVVRSLIHLEGALAMLLLGMALLGAQNVFLLLPVAVLLAAELVGVIAARETALEDEVAWLIPTAQIGSLVMAFLVYISNHPLTSWLASLSGDMNQTVAGVALGCVLLTPLFYRKRMPRWLRMTFQRLAGLPWLLAGVFLLVQQGSLIAFPSLWLGITLFLSPEMQRFQATFPRRSVIGSALAFSMPFIYLAGLVTALLLVERAQQVIDFSAQNLAAYPVEWMDLQVTYVTLRNSIFFFFTGLAVFFGLLTLSIAYLLEHWLASVEKWGKEGAHPLDAQELRQKFYRTGELSRLLEPLLQAAENFQSASEEAAARQRQADAALQAEKRRSTLYMISQQMKNVMDPLVAAQTVANALQKAYSSSLISILSYSNEEDTYIQLAAVGPSANTIPEGMRQKISAGLVAQATRLHKTQICNDSINEPNLITFEGQPFRSEVVIPLIQNGHLVGVVLLNSKKPTAFTEEDISAIEAAAATLTAAWDRSSHHERLEELVRSGIFLSSVKDPQTLLTQIAEITRQALQAYYCILVITEDDFPRIGQSGSAPLLQQSLLSRPTMHSIFAAAAGARNTLRIRDVRRDSRTMDLTLDSPKLRSLMGIPMRVNNGEIGSILVFGKRNGITFTPDDEMIAHLVALQASGVIENTLLSQERRANLVTTQLLYDLSVRIALAQNLEGAATAIAETVYNIGKADTSGLVLFTPENQVEAQVAVGVPANGKYPESFISLVMKTGERIIHRDENDRGTYCFAIQTPRRRYGVLWLRNRLQRTLRPDYVDNLETLSNQAAVALERAILLSETRQQTEQLTHAYAELETTYDQTLTALISSLDARDSETEGHSMRVAKIAAALGCKLGLHGTQLKALERGALLHDIGKIGTSDMILNKPGPLDALEWEMMKQHPDTGAHIVESIPFLAEAIPVIRYHHERWNGSGYPLGLVRTQIPLLARIFAVADTYDALTSDRPYRGKVAMKEAVEYIESQKGILFDPDIVDTLKSILSDIPPAEFLS